MDESKWYEGRHRYTDPEQRHVFIYIANPSSSGFYYNTNLVNPKEFKSYWDLIAPKWKGRYVSQEPSGTGLGASLQFYYYHPELGAEYIKKLFGDMQPVLGRDRRQITDWLAQGRYALCVGCRDTARAKSQGLPVDELDNVDWKEGVQLTSGGGSMSLIKGGPNPELTLADAVIDDLLALGTFRLKEKPKTALSQQSVRDWSFAEKARR